MKVFPVRFKIGSLDLGAIVTASNDNRKFKIEMVTGEPDPVVLRRGDDGQWTIENPGGRRISPQCYQDIGKAIDEHIEETGQL